MKENERQFEKMKENERKGLKKFRVQKIGFRT